MQLNPEFSLFVGRFHPLLVHLPIGLLSFAMVLHLVQWKKKSARLTDALTILWLLAAVSGGLSILTGWLLSSGGGYESQTLERHRNGGILVAVLSMVVFITYLIQGKSQRSAFPILRLVGIVSAIGSMILTGHWGGALTHGGAYLTEYSPFAASDSTAAAGSTARQIRDLDSAYLFEDVVMPILQAKCVSCHSEEKKKGEYLLTSHAAILQGGKSGAGVVPGNLATSELYRRISLPEDHKEFMPTDGKTPLTDEQKAILEWWIETGAHQRQRVTAFVPNAKRRDELVRFFGLDQQAVAGHVAPAPDPAAIDALLQNGYRVNLLTQTGNLLEVKFNGKGSSKPDLSVLTAVKQQLVWLQLENCQLEDADLQALAPLTSLFKLNLNRNPITEKGCSFLPQLTKLEYLNLYGTQVTEAGLPLLTSLPSLKKLYLWETKVDQAKIDSSGIPPKLELVLALESQAPGS
ncbi:MAG: hypothetical protein JNK20_12460 [Flavipsychrobacter sp.]|nr:hypothetical protein [Flavipsychrobacter sp.]